MGTHSSIGLAGPRQVRFSLDGEAYRLMPPSPERARELADAVRKSAAHLQPFMPWANDESNFAASAQFSRLIDAHAAFLKGTDYEFHLLDAEGTLAGGVGLHRRTPNGAGLEVGYWVCAERCGRGLCTAATKALVVVALDYFRSERVQCMHSVANPASRKVIEKAGFKLEGTLRGFLPVLPGSGMDQSANAGDAVMYSILPSDDLPWLAEARSSVEISTWEL